MQIYKITNLINNKIYIGKDTTSDPNYFGSGLLINRAFKKYGKENFTKEVIDIADDFDDLSSKEIYWISQYNSTDKKIGYNIATGGDGGDTLSNHPDLDLIKEKISKNSHTRGKTYEEAFGEEKAVSYKEKLKQNIHKSILSNQSKLKNQKKWQEYNDNFKNRCRFIKEEIDKGKLNEYLDELRLIKKRSSNNFLKNAKGFYNFFGDQLRYVLGKFKINERDEFSKINSWLEKKDLESLIKYMDKNLPNRFFKKRNDFYRFIGNDMSKLIYNEFKRKRKLANISINENKKYKIKINDVEYNSIIEASKLLNIDRKTISYRLKSTHFKNYLYQDDELNKKYDKFIEIDPYLSKKEPISINGKKYESITQASKYLKKTNDYINWRLNSQSYPEWFYLDKEVKLKDTGEPKMKRVSILDNEYSSIAEAVLKTGIDRQIMRYRIKSEKYPEYFYIKFPFSESIESKNISIRTFKSDTDENLLVWHRDREDRIVEATHQTDWLVQIDNQLPQSLNSEVFIPKGIYHRVIKGTGDLEIKVQKLF